MCRWCVYCSFTTVYGWIQRRKIWTESCVLIGYLGVQDGLALVPPFSRLFLLVSFWPSLFGRDCWILASFFLSLSLSFFLSFLLCVFIDVLSSSRSLKTPSLTLPFALAFSGPKSLIHDFGLPKYLFQDLRRGRLTCCTHAFGVARVVRMPRQEAILKRRIDGGKL